MLEAGLNEVGAAALSAQLFAAGLDAEGLFDGAESESSREAIVEEVEVFILELDDLSAIDTDEVVVGGALEEIGIVSGLAVAEVDFLQESGLGEEGEGAVEGGAGGGGPGFSEAFPEVVGGEMFMGSEDDVEDGVPLGRVTEAFSLDEGLQPLARLGRHNGSSMAFWYGMNMTNIVELRGEMVGCAWGSGIGVMRGS